MAHFKDLSVCTYFSLADCSSLRAVGWLSREVPYATGEVTEAAFGKLCQLTQNPWSPMACAGVHFCDLCRFTGNSVGQFEGQHSRYAVSAASASVSLFVPGDGVIYVSPTSITHSIDAHGYCPPAEFLEAVLRCPPMRSMAYLKAILANGGRKWGIKLNG